jgi:zinc/manganese transport system ATP-binding protein
VDAERQHSAAEDRIHGRAGIDETETSAAERDSDAASLEAAAPDTAVNTATTNPGAATHPATTTENTATAADEAGDVGSQEKWRIPARSGEPQVTAGEPRQIARETTGETSSATSESDGFRQGGSTASESARERGPVVRLRGARLAYGERTLWDGLDLAVETGEFIAILGPNGSGKTSLLRMLLGQVAPSAGAVEIAGSPARVGNPYIGYVPQQKTIDAGVRLRGVDLVGLGVDGHRWGLGWRGRKQRRRKIAEAVAQVGAQHYAHTPLETMSGGEQQRLRVAQALAGDPRVLLCDEPLLSLDMANQRLVAELIDARRRSHDTAVLFVTHEINPVLPLVDRVLYLVDGKFRIGTPDEVMTSEVLSELYRTEVDVLRVRGRLVVVGTGDTMDALGGEHE